MKLCPKCKRMLDRNPYFQRYECTNIDCDFCRNIEKKDIEYTIDGLLNVIDTLINSSLLIINNDNIQVLEECNQVIKNLKSQWYSEWI